LCNSCASLAGLVLSFIACFILLVIAPLEPRVSYADERSSSVSLLSFLSFFLSFFHLLISEVARSIVAKFLHMFDGDPNL